MSASDSSKNHLENDLYRIVVNEHGAELQSFFSKKINAELLWQAGNAWPKHAPVLFPIVGQLKDNKTEFQGKFYSLSRHGFARDLRFDCVFKNETSLHFELQSDDETRLKFPFDFCFQVRYELKDATLLITMEVLNKGTSEMYCSYGAHPAFNVPMFEGKKFEEYELRFEPAEHRIRRYPLDQNLISSMPVGVATPDGSLPLTPELFAADALVMKEAFESVALVHKISGIGVKMQCADWPYFGIWSAKGGDFVCLEPWQGIADTTESTGKLNEKEGILLIPAGQKHGTTFSLEAVG